MKAATTNYRPYNLDELNRIIQEPWEISDEPYKLHASFAIHSLFDSFIEEDDKEEGGIESYNNYWGWKLPIKLVDRLVKDIMEDFNDAANNYKPIRIANKNYSIRKANSYDHSRLDKIFNFPIQDSEYIIDPSGIMDLAGKTVSGLEKYRVSSEQAKKNRIYLRQIIKLAEDDKNDGWERLTDIEIVIYCWALFYNKNQVENMKQFLNEYKAYIYLPVSEMEFCYSEKSQLRNRPSGMYAFSAERTERYHSQKGLQSVAMKIPPEEAEDYWYNVALKGNFKPIDH